MKVVVSKPVVDALLGTDYAWKLQRFILFACDGRHVVCFDPPSVVESCLSLVGSEIKEYYRQVLRNSARSSSKMPADSATVRIEVVGASQWTDPVAVLTVDDALAVLEERLGILVENAENDWNFLCGIMRKSERTRVIQSVSKGWIDPLHGGGSSLLSLLQTRMLNRAKGLRTFVVFDSDRLHPDEFDSSWTPDRPGKRPAACQAFEWEAFVRTEMPQRYWMLRRRFIESYMPEIELAGAVGAGRSDSVNAMFRMSQTARWYFNMKGGFRGDAGRDDSERPRNLYDNLSPADKTALHEGFGPRIAKRYELAIDNEFAWDNEARLEASVAIPKLMRLL